MLELKLAEAVEQRTKEFALRTRMAIAGYDAVNPQINQQAYLSFSSNNYLGLANHPKVVEACTQALKQYGVGSGSAYLVTGYGNAHRELEEKLAAFLGFPSVLLFSSGYMANAGVLSALFNSRDHLFADKLNHASLVDGCLNSKAILHRYPHGRPKTIIKKCAVSEGQSKVIITEGLFGMDGTLGPMSDICEIATQHKALTYLDDAHGIGVLGHQGRGVLDVFNLSARDINFLTGTFGKAFGTYGAFVAGSELMIDSLIQLTRTYLYTTATPPALASATLASLELIQNEPWRRAQLLTLISYFRNCCTQLGITTMADPLSPIQPIIVGSNEKSVLISQKLFEKGILVKPIRPPTVPKNTARLRISITTNHTKNDIDNLLENIHATH